MSQPRYQIFVSSTFRDLQEERQAVLNAILKLNQFPAGMEIFPAVNDTAWEHIEKVIKDSDYYVLIIGGKYGSIDSESGLSYTEKEYDFALSQNIPVLAFTHSDEESIAISKSEINFDIREKLQNFKQKVGGNHHWNYWKTLDELKANVTASLSIAFVMNPQIGWVKSDFDKTDLLKQLTELKQKHSKLLNRFYTLEKSEKFLNQEAKLSQGDDEIIIVIKLDYKRIELTTTWNKLLIYVGRSLEKYGKVPEYNVGNFIVEGLKNSFDKSAIECDDLWHYARIDNEVLLDIGNQLFAFGWIKISFDRHNVRHWTLTEKGRKVFVNQIAIYR